MSPILIATVIGANSSNRPSSGYSRPRAWSYDDDCGCCFPFSFRSKPKHHVSREDLYSSAVHKAQLEQDRAELARKAKARRTRPKAMSEEERKLRDELNNVRRTLWDYEFMSDAYLRLYVNDGTLCIDQTQDYSVWFAHLSRRQDLEEIQAYALDLQKRAEAIALLPEDEYGESEISPTSALVREAEWALFRFLKNYDRTLRQRTVAIQELQLAADALNDVKLSHGEQRLSWSKKDGFQAARKRRFGLGNKQATNAIRWLKTIGDAAPLVGNQPFKYSVCDEETGDVVSKEGNLFDYLQDLKKTLPDSIWTQRSVRKAELDTKWSLIDSGVVGQYGYLR